MFLGRQHSPYRQSLSPEVSFGLFLAFGSKTRTIIINYKT